MVPIVHFMASKTLAEISQIWRRNGGAGDKRSGAGYWSALKARQTKVAPLQGAIVWPFSQELRKAWYLAIFFLRLQRKEQASPRRLTRTFDFTQ